MLAEEFLHALREARHDYYACYQAGNIDSWTLVQYLALPVALVKDWNDQEFRERWTAVVVMSHDALRSGNIRRRVWALAAFAELRILETAWADLKVCWQQAREHIDDLFDIIDLAPNPGMRVDAYSIYRQARRYYLWEWGTPGMIAVAILLGIDLDERSALAHWTRTF